MEKIKTEHYPVGAEVFVISDNPLKYDGRDESHYALCLEEVESISVEDKGTTYWLKSGWECEKKDVFDTQEEALEVLKYKLIEQCKKGS